MNKKKVEIITLHRIVNYGSVLQAYATQKIIKELGYTVEFTDYYPERMHMFGMLKRIKNKNEIFRKSFLITTTARIIMLPSYVKRFYIFKKFVKNNLSLTSRQFKDESQLKNDPPLADIYCTGSDQVWNSGWNEKIDKPFFLDYVPKGKKCISYASSFGKSKLEDWEKCETKKQLKKYSFISMREQSGVEILEDLGIKNAKAVLDPTLLFDGNEWKEIASKKYEKKKYILIYNLNRNKKIDEYAKLLSKKTKLPIYYITYSLHEFYKYGKMKCCVKVEDFLSLMANATYVVTDSFHATAFSLNFNRNFMIVFPEKYSTRIENILKLVKLENRIVKNINDLSLLDENINFKKVNEILNKKRKDSIAYLKLEIE